MAICGDNAMTSDKNNGVSHTMKVRGARAHTQKHVTYGPWAYSSEKYYSLCDVS